MSNQRENFAEDLRREPLGCMKKMAEKFRSSPVCRHIRGMERESLLVARSVLDVLIDCLEEEGAESPVKPCSAKGEEQPQQEARRVPVEEEEG